MKYLFFDIECAGVTKNAAKICAFGYCLTDEKFNILEKEDILINPQGGFHLTDRKGSQGIVLPYSYGEFKKYPTFPQAVEKIRTLVEDKDSLIAGHATMNDVKYLNLESKRFSLPSFNFSFADTQFVYMNKIKEFSRQFALGKIAEEMGVEFTPHRAVDDAFATMKIAAAICKEEQVDFVGLLDRYQITLGKIENYEVTQNTSTAYEEYLEEARRKKEERERAKMAFHNFIDREKRKRAKEGKLKGKRVCFSLALATDVPYAKKLASALFAESGFYSFHAEECDIYVQKGGETGQRLKSAMENKARIMTAEEFSAYLS
jgi:DNA polymerase III epsilon subunit-like protein